MKRSVIHSLSVNLVSFFIDKGLDGEKKDIYIYGLEILLSNVMTIFFSITILGVLGFFVEACIYWGIFVVTRECFHGYHFKKFYQCFLLSIVTGFIGTLGGAFLYSCIGISGICIISGIVLATVIIFVIIRKKGSDLIQSFIMIIIQWIAVYWLHWTVYEYYGVFILSAEAIALMAYFVMVWREKTSMTL